MFVAKCSWTTGLRAGFGSRTVTGMSTTTLTGATPAPAGDWVEIYKNKLGRKLSITFQGTPADSKGFKMRGGADIHIQSEGPQTRAVSFLLQNGETVDLEAGNNNHVITWTMTIVPS